MTEITRMKAPVGCEGKDPNDARTDPLFHDRVEAGIADRSKQVANEQPQQSIENQWPSPVDLFTESPVPPFPIDALPDNFQKYAEALSASSGFDAGAYGFDMLAAASGVIDQRARMAIGGSWTVPAFLWAAKVARSGNAKSPILNASVAPIRNINSAVLKESKLAFRKWRKNSEGKPKDDREPQPKWKQLILNDTTIEAFGALSKDNPEGLILVQDELSEFIGRMDAYSGAGKDRGGWLRAYDGGMHTINRSRREPLVIENFSVCLIGGIQPEILAGMLRNKGAADGLYQRFLMYQVAGSGKVDLSAPIPEHTKVAVEHTYSRLRKWTAKEKIHDTRLCTEASQQFQEYVNNFRVIVSRTIASRLAEHLSKYPATMARVAFTLHCLECAANNAYKTEVSIETFMRAMTIMRVLYRHSESVYMILDATDTKCRDLTRSVGEAILSKQWPVFSIGDLTRDATHWRDADTGTREVVIDTLIELGWINDVTQPQIPGKRGRRSEGRFSVNPAVFTQFEKHSVRITRMRAERAASIKACAVQKRVNLLN